MKKVKSVVWNFFDRVFENGRCTSVLCKLCERTFKYYGNTTNLRIHLSKKHPIQWELREHATKWEAREPRNDDDDDDTRTSIQSTLTPGNNVRYALTIKPAQEDSMPKIDIERVNVMADKDEEEDHLVQQLHGSDEEWLEEDITNLFDSRHKTQVKQEFPSHSSPYLKRMSRRSVALQSPTKAKDEYSAFGEYIANKLRKIKSVRTKANVQQLIATILWQTEYGYYEDIESVRNIILSQPSVPQTSTAIDTSSEIQEKKAQE